MTDSAPQWDKLFNVKGKVVLVTGGSRGAFAWFPARIAYRDGS
jgi:NAD(P)-dependent dehydrogenase (short-subunit alcohol dehydrogenase family)